MFLHTSGGFLFRFSCVIFAYMTLDKQRINWMIFTNNTNCWRLKFSVIWDLLGVSFPLSCTNPSISLPLSLSNHSFFHHPYHPHQHNTPCLSVPHPFFHCLILKVKAMQSSQTEQTMWHHIPEDLNLWWHCCEYLECYKPTNKQLFKKENKTPLF